ncbi:hypothetical protein SALBM217S_00744 [Streptomyces griseoloalbus]
MTAVTSGFSSPASGAVPPWFSAGRRSFSFTAVAPGPPSRSVRRPSGPPRSPSPGSGAAQHDLGEPQLDVAAREGADERVQGLQLAGFGLGEPGEQDLVELGHVPADPGTGARELVHLAADGLNRLLGVPSSYSFGSPVVTHACPYRAASRSPRGPVAADGDGSPGPLDAAGDVARLVRRVEVALVRHGVLGEQPVEQGHQLGEAVGTLGAGLTAPGQGGGVETGAARADAQGDAATGDVVEGDELLGQGHRVPEVRRGHQCAQTHPLGHARGGGQGRDGTEPPAVAEAPPGQVVVGVAGVEAQLRPAPRRNGCLRASGGTGGSRCSDAGSWIRA